MASLDCFGASHLAMTGEVQLRASQDGARQQIVDRGEGRRRYCGDSGRH